MKPSQDLTQKQNQLKELETQIAYQQTIYKSLQEKTEAQKKQFESDTVELTKLAKEQVNEAIADKKKELKDLETEHNTSKESLAVAMAEYSKLKSKMEIELEDLKLQVTTERTLLDSNDQVNQRLQAENVALDKTIEGKRTENSQLSTTIDAQKNELGSVKGFIEANTTRLQGLKDNITAMQHKLAENTTAYEQQISMLEARSESLAKDILEQQQNQDQVAENLAKWAKKLEAEEQNLRIREEKLQQRDKVLIRNANLLKM